MGYGKRLNLESVDFKRFIGFENVEIRELLFADTRTEQTVFNQLFGKSGAMNGQIFAFGAFFLEFGAL